MVKVSFHPSFSKTYSKIKDKALKERIAKHILKIAQNPDLGKPMRYARQGTREVYIPPYRLSYTYRDNEVFILEFYNKDEQ